MLRCGDVEHHGPGRSLVRQVGDGKADRAGGVGVEPRVESFHGQTGAGEGLPVGGAVHRAGDPPAGIAHRRIDLRGRIVYRNRRAGLVAGGPIRGGGHQTVAAVEQPDGGGGEGVAGKRGGLAVHEHGHVHRIKGAKYAPRDRDGTGFEGIIFQR